MLQCLTLCSAEKKPLHTFFTRLTIYRFKTYCTGMFTVQYTVQKKRITEFYGTIEPKKFNSILYTISPHLQSPSNYSYTFLLPLECNQRMTKRCHY